MNQLCRTTTLGLCVLMLGTGCAGAATTIQILYHDDPKPLMPAIERFEAKFPEVKVEIVKTSPSSLTATTLSMFAAGTEPDIFVNDAAGGELPFVAAGMAIPLDSYFARDQETFKDWYPGVWPGVTYFGHRYAMPNIDFGSYVNWVNLDMLHEAGLALPPDDWTQDDFVDLGKKLLHTGADGKADRWISTWKSGNAPWMPMFLNRGGSFTAPDDPERITFSDAKSAEALQWMQTLRYGLGIIPTTQEVSDGRGAYLAGRTAMGNAGSWFWESAKSAPFHQAVILEPQGPTGRTLANTYWGWMISTQSQHPDLAWELLKSLTSPETQAEAVKARGENVNNRVVMQQYFGQGIPVERFRDTFIDYFKYPIVMLVPTIAPDAWKTIQTAVQTVLRNSDQPAASVLASVAGVAQQQSTEFWRDAKAKFAGQEQNP